MVLTAKKLGISLKEISIPTCHCKDLNALSMASNPDKLAMYNLAIKSCTCGSGLVSCDLPAHLGAIEGIAATYDKLQDHSKALKYASLYITMAPQLPEGYLRMAKALRLMDTSQSSDTKPRCTWIYQQAIESVRTYGNKNHEKLKVRFTSRYVSSWPTATHKVTSVQLQCPTGTANYNGHTSPLSCANLPN